MSSFVETKKIFLRVDPFPLKPWLKVTYPLLTAISTIKDENSAAEIHYNKNVNGKVVAQSIAFRVVSIYWQGSSVPIDI